MTELNQKLTKHSQKTLDTGVYTGEKYLCKNLEVKEGGGRLLEGGIFREIMAKGSGDTSPNPLKATNEISGNVQHSTDVIEQERIRTGG